MGTRPDTASVDFQLAIRDLCRRVDFLASRVAHLETVLEERPQLGWVVLTEECPPVESGVYGSRLCQAEDGPPEIPQHLVDFASTLIAGNGSFSRARRAWEGGFWCGVALRTRTRFQPLAAITVPETHWVIFRARGISRPFWVQSREEVTHILNRLAPPLRRILLSPSWLDLPQSLNWTCSVLGGTFTALPATNGEIFDFVCRSR